MTTSTGCLTTEWREGQRIQDLQDILWPRDCVDRVAALFKAYFDESWDERQEKILVIGGMIGRYEQWAKIEWPWKELLDKYGIEYYRASEAEHASKQFRKEPFRTEGEPLSKKQRILLGQVREEFFQVLMRGIVSGLAIGVPIAIFKQVLDTPEKLAKFDGSPYYICGHTVMLRMLQAMRRDINSKELVAFIFDRQQEYAAGMMNIHSRLALPECEFHSQVGSITFDDKRRFIPLQVADTLAYEVRKDQEHRLAVSDAPERPEFARLKAEGKIFQISLCERECLEWYLDH